MFPVRFLNLKILQMSNPNPYQRMWSPEVGGCSFHLTLFTCYRLHITEQQRLPGGPHTWWVTTALLVGCPVFKLYISSSYQKSHLDSACLDGGKLWTILSGLSTALLCGVCLCFTPTVLASPHPLRTWLSRTVSQVSNGIKTFCKGRPASLYISLMGSYFNQSSKSTHIFTAQTLENRFKILNAHQ